MNGDSTSDLKARWQLEPRRASSCQEAGIYRIHARVGDELVPLTDEYQIALVEDQKPTIEIREAGPGLAGEQHRGSAGSRAREG